jgi:hypothetical protein
MDDKGKGGGLYTRIISVYNFTVIDIEKLSFCLQKNFNISSTLHSATTSR